MGYIEQNLVPEENVLYKTRLHWIVLVRPLIVGAVLGSMGLAFVVGGYEASGKDRSYGGMIILESLLVVGAAVSIGAGLVRKNSTEVADAAGCQTPLDQRGVWNLQVKISVRVRIPSAAPNPKNQNWLGTVFGHKGLDLCCVLLFVSDFEWVGPPELSAPRYHHG